MREIINGKKICLGTCYYPEHWDACLWPRDLDRMLEAGIEAVRVAEFAWSKIEPREGEYTYEFFDSFLDLAAEKGMKVIFCTPTATPPAWLTEAYPEVLNADKEGHLYRHGTRRHYNYNSPVYQEFCRKIVEHSASHYGRHPAIIGWQIDNELNCENNEFYSESDGVAFRRFLKEKYGTLEALNRAWGTVFWNQTYTAWSEVCLPGKTNSGTNNPHQLLDYLRFVSDSACRFAGMQADIIRKYCKEGDFVTTNGIFGNLDNHRLTRDSLDFMTYDSYPNFSYGLDGYRPEDRMKDRGCSRSLAEVRSLSPVFGIMEQQSGANGWTDRMEAPTPRPGQMTLWTMQSIAHGADYVSYFRWRTCTFGTEMYWHGILDYSGRENRRIREVRDIHARLQKLQEVAGARYLAKVAILRDYDNCWDAQIDKWHGRVEWLSQDSLFTALQLEHVPFDYVYLNHETALEDLRQYHTVFYPHAVILTRERMSLLERYVAAGGRLIMGCRTGYKDIDGRCVTEYLPGLAATLTGTDIPEYSFVAPDEGRVTVDWDGTLMEAAVFNDLLQPLPDSHAQVLAAYASGYYAGTPALIRNLYGKGEAYYFGAAFSLDTARTFLKKLSLTEPYADLFLLPEDCELAVREKEGRKYFFLLNYTKEEQTVDIKQPMRDLLEQRPVQGKQSLPPYGVKVLAG